MPVKRMDAKTALKILLKHGRVRLYGMQAYDELDAIATENGYEITSGLYSDSKITAYLVRTAEDEPEFYDEEYLEMVAEQRLIQESDRATFEYWNH